MPRATRHYLPGYVWHLTHRCHEGEFLLKFGRDRLAWIDWLYEARKRYGLCVLNYTATSNHGHVLTWDQGQGEIARSMQLIAGRTGQDYNRRKGRRGAFWEDRYHATAVESGAHLACCLVYTISTWCVPASFAIRRSGQREDTTRSRQRRVVTGSWIALPSRSS